MSRWSRFGLIEAVLLASTLGAVAKGLDTHAGKALLTASGVLLGIFLAVFGQTYQTGADAWTFFAGWTALMGPWVLLSNAAPLWMLWLVLGNLTLGTWLVQFAAPADWINPGFHPLLLAILNLTALFGRERAVSQGKDWLAASWTRWIPLASSLALLTWPATLWSASAMHDPGRYFFPAKGLAGPDSVLALALVGAAAWAYYRHRVRDLVAVNFLALSLGIFVYCNSLALLRKLGLGHRLAGFTSWMFLAAAITVGIGWAVTTGMRGIAEQIRSEKEEQA